MEKNLLEMHMLKRLIAVIIVILMCCAGCNAPTYPKEKFVESLKDICKKEYQVDAQAKLVGKTLVVFLPLEELFDEKMEILPGAIDKIEKVITAASRIIFSTDAEVSFFTVVAADIKTTAAELILIKYVEDVHRLINSWISQDEYRRRILWQINFNPKHLNSAAYDFNVEELTLPVFLARQIAQRLNFASENSGYSKVRITGEYIEQEKLFFFSLITAEKNKFFETFSPDILREAALVLSSYKFEDFNGVEVRNLLNNESVTIEKKELNNYLK
ncbi:MAG: hypothetical protein ABII88_07915 [Candidatus Omnitrophota bacterium]